MLQHLELADGLPKLFSGLTVFDCGLVQNFHCTNRFGTDCQNTVVDTCFEQAQTIADFAQYCITGYFHIFKRDFRSAHAINRRVVPFGTPACIGINQKKGDTRFIFLIT